MRVLDILVLFFLGQISVNPVKNAFATQQLAFLATSIRPHYAEGIFTNVTITGHFGFVFEANSVREIT